MNIKDLIGLSKDQLLEMDKSQKGPPGWNISDDEPGGKEHYVKAAKSKDVIKSATKSLNKEMGKAHKKVKETRYGSRDAYQRDYDSSRTGFGRRPREDDEYVNGDDDEVHAHRQYMARAEVPHDVHINGKKWKTFGSHSHASNVAKKIKGATVHKSLEESATAGATSAANIGTVVSPHIAIGRRNIGKKSYTGSPGKSGTKAPKLPKIVQPKNKDGTAKNALDIKGSSLFGGPIKSKAKTKNKKR